MTRPFKPFKKGSQLSARELNRLQRAVEKHERQYGVSGLRSGPMETQTAGGVIHESGVYQPFYAQITDRRQGCLTTLASSIDADDTSISVQSTLDSPADPNGSNRLALHPWPVTAPFVVEITAKQDSDDTVTPNELILVTDHGGVDGERCGTTWTVTRGYLGTTPAAHSSGVEVTAVKTTQYAWQEVKQYEPGRWLEHVDGRNSGEDDDVFIIPAYETKGHGYVPIDGSAVVELKLGYDSQTYYLFEYWPGANDVDCCRTHENATDTWTTDQTNYDWPAKGRARYMRIAVNASVKLYGWKGGSTGKHFQFENTGTSNLTVKHRESGDSGNQFSMADSDDVIIKPGEIQVFKHNGTYWIPEGWQLTVEDDDQSTSVKNVHTIRFENDDFDVSEVSVGIAKVAGGVPDCVVVDNALILPTAAPSVLDPTCWALYSPTRIFLWGPTASCHVNAYCPSFGSQTLERTEDKGVASGYTPLNSAVNVPWKHASPGSLAWARNN